MLRTVTVQACRPNVTLKKRSAALETASASKTCTKTESSSTTDTYPTLSTSTVETSTISTGAITFSSSSPGSYKAMSSYPTVSSTFEYRYVVASSVVRPHDAVTSSIIQQYSSANSIIYQPYSTVASTTTITSPVGPSTPTPLVLCAEGPPELQRFECARITQGCSCLSRESPTVTQIVFSSVTVVEQSTTTFMAHITTTAAITSTQSVSLL